MMWRLTCAAMAAVLFSSCSSSDDGPLAEEFAAIAFDAATGSRAAAGLSSFDVWATMHDPADTDNLSTLFDATKVTLDGDAWTYGETQYWFPGMAYNFRAIAPSGVEGVTFTTGVGEDSYLSIEGFDSRSSIDLLAATDRREIAIGSGVQPPVAMRFSHLLCRVSFVGSSDEKVLGAGRRVILESASIYGVAAVGDWDGSGFNPQDSWYGEWTVQPGDEGEERVPVWSVEYPDGLELSPEGTPVFSGEDVILAIPQRLATSACLEIKFHYNVNSAHTFTHSIPLTSADVITEWQCGHSYRYPFSVNSGIFFSTPTVEPWREMPVDGDDFNIE